jgi:hypothetical protein
VSDLLEVARGVAAGETVVRAFDDQLADGAEVQVATTPLPSATATPGGR